MSEYDSPDPGWQQYRVQMDENNLRTLAVLYKVWAAMQALVMCCVGGYLFIVGAAVTGAVAADQTRGHAGPPPGLFVGIFGSIFFVVATLLVTTSVLNCFASRWIEQRKNWTGIIVMAALNCLSIPLGLGLGVFTMIVLNRPSVRSRFL